jgi:hypothetical protein
VRSVGIVVAALLLAAGCGKSTAESKDASPQNAPDAARGSGSDLSLLRDEMSDAARALRTAQANEERAAGVLAADCAERMDSADCKAVLVKLKALAGDAGDDPRAIHAVARDLSTMLPLGDAKLTDEAHALAVAIDTTANAIERLDRLKARLESLEK